MVGVTHCPAFRVTEVFERLFFVYADHAPGHIRHEIAAVAVEVPQQPVCGVLPLHLLEDVRVHQVEIFPAHDVALLPVFQSAAVERIEPPLERSKSSIKRSRAYWYRRVRVYDGLHLVPGFLRVSPEHFRVSAFALGWLEQPFMPLCVRVRVHLPCAAEVVRHPVRDLNVWRYGWCVRVRWLWLCRLCWCVPCRLSCRGCGALRLCLCASCAVRRLGLYVRPLYFLVGYGASALWVSRREKFAVAEHLIHAALLFVHLGAYRADALIVGGQPDLHAVPDVALRLCVLGCAVCPCIVAVCQFCPGYALRPVPVLPCGVPCRRFLRFLLCSFRLAFWVRFQVGFLYGFPVSGVG